MRYFLLCAAVLGAGALYAQNYNETVAAISYNPSRFGAYSHLKIAKEATLTGVDAQTNSADVNIMTKGTVLISGGPDCTGTNECHQIDSVVPMAGEVGCSDFSDNCGENDFTATLQINSGTLVQGGDTPYTEDVGNIEADGDDEYKVSFPSIDGTKLYLAPQSVDSEESELTGSNIYVKEFKNLDDANKKLEVDTLIMQEGTKIILPCSESGLSIGETNIDCGSWNKNEEIGWRDRIDDNGTKAKILSKEKKIPYPYP